MVYDELLHAILSGKIAPGERLITETIVNRLGVSPMPVREALTRLEASGFLYPNKKREKVVIKLSKESLEETLNIRLVLETMAVEKAVPHRSEKTIERLEDLHNQYVKTYSPFDSDESLRVNRKFHFTIYKEARMPILLRHISMLWDIVSPYLHILMREVKNYERDVDLPYHRDMLDGMKNRDVDRVVRWLRIDLADAAHVVLNNFDKIITY
ncbi:MAG: GntR family transcriptional regulator [Deltaproteobacteria bacterium]|nr:GntR family transcriptional regulator [Deltaproteobacteria bacterium]